MTIGIDIRVLARGKRSGVEEYLINLLPHMFELGKDIKFKLFYNSWQKAPLSKDWLKLPNVEVREFKIPNRLLSFFSKYFNYPKVDKMLGGVDVFFSPHFLVVGLSEKCRHIITFHDLSFEYFPEFFSWDKRFWHLSVNPKAQAKKADKITAVSESTKNDLVDLYGIPESKIKVIYSGVGDEFKPIGKDSQKCGEIKQKYSLPDKFILYLGTLEPRKNVVSLIRAFEMLRSQVKGGKYQDMKLVLAGPKGWLYNEIFETAQNSIFSKDIFFTGFIDSKDKAFIYNLSELFVYPSFFEGFGFPPLEAMACGVPVITSNNSSLPEIVADAGLTIDAYNYAELAFAIEEILRDSDLRKLLIARGLAQAKKFSWRECAEQLLTELIN